MEDTGGTARQRSFTLLSWIIIAVFALRSFMLLCKPVALADERLWLEWLGAWILQHGALPHAVGNEALVASGSAWLPQSWTLAVCIEWCALHGMDLLPIIAMTCIVTVAPIVTYVRMQRSGADPAGIIFALIFVTQTIDVGLDMRAAMVSYAAAAIVFAAIVCNDRRQFVIPFIVVALVNIHATALLLAWLPAIACTATFIAQRTWNRDLQRLFVTSCASIAATFCSPFGTAIYGFAFSLGGGEIHRYIAEWTPPLFDLASPFTATQLGEGVLLTVLIGAWWRRHPLTAVEASVVAVCGLLMLYAERFIVLYILAAAPAALRHGLRFPSVRLAALGTPVAAWFFAVLLLAPTLTVVLRHMAVDTSVALPGRPGLFVPNDWLEPWRIGRPADERVYCSNFTYCNSYLWAGASDLLDGRADAFPLEAYTVTKQINGMRPGWQSLVRRLKINVMVIERTLPKLALAVSALPGWHKVASTEDNDTYSDERTVRKPRGTNRKTDSS